MATTQGTHDVRVEARPHPLAIDPRRSAVIVVDMQNDFGAAGGMFAREGIDLSGIRAAVAPTARVLVAARQAGMPVVYLKMGFAADLSDAGEPEAPNRVRLDMIGQLVIAPDGSESRVRDIRDRCIAEGVAYFHKQWGGHSPKAGGRMLDG